MSANPTAINQINMGKVKNWIELDAMHVHAMDNSRGIQQQG